MNRRKRYGRTATLVLMLMLSLRGPVYAGSLPENCERDSPKPGTVLGVDKRAGILIQTGDGILCVAQLQWQAKKAVDWKSFINGSRNFIGVCCTKSE